MKGFTKKMIWFFGFWFMDTLEELVFFHTHGYNIELNPWGVFFIFGVWLIPLTYMKDDKEKKKGSQSRGSKK